MAKPPPPITSTSVIEGNGPYLCILRSSSELFSGVASVFVRDVGFYHCSFQHARRIKKMVLGYGFYHCIYQHPGNQITIRQGVGQYFCFFQTIRWSRNFQDPPPPSPPGTPPMMMEKRNFLEFFGSVNYIVPAPSPLAPSPLALFQLLGIYVYGPEGTNRNFGLIQLIEGFNIGLESLTTPFDLGVKVQDDRSIQTQVRNMQVNQNGIYQYHFNGEEFDEGKGDLFQKYAYNFTRTIESHDFTLLLTQYEFEGQGRNFLDDLHFVQVWGIYTYNFEPKDPTKIVAAIPLDLEVIIMAQYDLSRYENEILTGGFDFIQLIIQYQESFVGYGDFAGDTGSLSLTGVYQGNFNDPESDLELNIDYFLGIGVVRYNFIGPNPGVVGFVQVTVIYQQPINPPTLNYDPDGYVQFLGQYGKTYQRSFFGLPGQATWIVQGIGEFVFSDLELSNGFVKFQVQYVVNTTGVLGSGVSSVTLLGLYQCIWFGKKMIKSFCYFQLYTYYMGGVPGPGVNPGQAVLLVQFYQEVSVL